jgi:hypothetical protein
MFPVEQVAADGVPPAHVPPFIAFGVVLVEEVILAIEEDQPVRVVHEVLRGCEVKTRAKRLV